MRFARREGVPQPWRQRVQLCARPRGTPLWALQTTYPGRRRRLHARAWISDRGLHCHYSVAGAAAACALTIRRDAHDRAGVRRHADARATAQHSAVPVSRLHRCASCTAARPPWLCAGTTSGRCSIASHRMGNGVPCVQGRRRTTAQADARRRAAGRAVLSLPHADACGVHSRGREWAGMAAGLGFNRANGQADECELGAAGCVLVGTWASSRKSSRRRTAL